MSDELRELVAKLRKSADAYDDAATDANDVERDRRFYEGAALARSEDADLLEAALAEKPDERPAGMTVDGLGLPVDGAPWAMANSLSRPLLPDGYLEARIVTTRRENEDDEETVAYFLGPNRDKNAEAIIALVNEAERPQLSAEQVLSLAKGIVTAAVELAVLRGNLCYEDSPPIDVVQCAEVVTDTWNAMRGIDTCAEEECEELKQFRAALLTGVAEKVVYMLQGVQTDAVNMVSRGNIIDRVRALGGGKHAQVICKACHIETHSADESGLCAPCRLVRDALREGGDAT